MAKRKTAPVRQPGKLRCAVYTRKSTEEGLDQAFNSLDAQREACAAYVLSQQHEGWSLYPEAYDDGGFSGGSMERPGLKRLLADVEAGRVDVIIVYKVDRLTRSLADFAKIVEVLDARGASFVSVTQAFNTTSSMGRLTLNVLLSFAQFEREVTGERIRDKVAASKKKGMWMGGVVPLGYDVKDRKLVVNEAEAISVRLIYDRYLALGSIGDLAAELDRRCIRSKQRTLADGTAYGARPFSKGALAHLLKNRAYVGEVTHKDVSYPGEHQPIVDRAIWDRVQVMIAQGRSSHRQAERADNSSPLAGMISDGEGRAMTPSHATKGARRYRYYVTAPDTPAGRTPADGWRIPAGEIEDLVRTRLAAFLTDEATIIGRVSARGPQNQLQPLLDACRAAAAGLANSVPAELRATLLLLDARVQIATHSINIDLSPAALLGGCGADAPRATLIVPAKLTRRGHELRLAYPVNDRDAPASPEVKLLGLLAKADAAYSELVAGPALSKARRAHLVRLARLKFLAPDVVTSILDGRQPVQLSARQLLRTTELPISWSEQRSVLGTA